MDFDDLTHKEMIEETYWQTRYLSLKAIKEDLEHGAANRGMNGITRDHIIEAMYFAKGKVLKTL